MPDNSLSLTVRKMLPAEGDGFHETPQDVNVTRCYFHMGNGGATFAVDDAQSGEPWGGTGPRLTVSLSREGGEASISLRPSTEALRDLAFTLLRAAAYPFRSGEPRHGGCGSAVNTSRYGNCERDEQGRRFMDFTFSAEQLHERRMTLLAELTLLGKLERLLDTHGSDTSPNDDVELHLPGMAGKADRSTAIALARMMGHDVDPLPEPVPYPT